MNLFKTFGILWGVLFLLSVLFSLAIAGGIVYFIVFACTHWLKW